MKRNKNALHFISIFIKRCFNNITAGKNSTPVQVNLDTFKLVDQVRKREIPIAVYSLKANKNDSNRKVIIFSHGYRQNRGGAYLAYSYLTSYLAAKGYVVISIQHDLPTDGLLPRTGNAQVVRRPFWDRGVDTIRFVINEMKKTNPDLDFRHITLIGHSNGGDMTALFAQKYPDIAERIITLDNRRMPLPRTNQPRVYSLRSCDQPADKGVLPTVEEQKEFNIRIIKLPNTIHNKMSNKASHQQRQEIRDYILSFLEE